MKRKTVKGGLFGLKRRSRKNKINDFYDKLSKLKIRSELQEIFSELKKKHKEDELLPRLKETIEEKLKYLTRIKYSSKILSYSDRNREKLEKELIELLNRVVNTSYKLVKDKYEYVNLVDDYDRKKEDDDDSKEDENTKKTLYKQNYDFYREHYDEYFRKLVKDFQDFNSILEELKNFYATRYGVNNDHFDKKNILEFNNDKKNKNVTISSRTKLRSKTRSRTRSRSRTKNTTTKAKYLIYEEG
jgi:hypothetical protein